MPAPEVPPNGKYPTYAQEIETRYKDVENTKGEPEHLNGEDVWFWIKGDQGAWDGPDVDWRNHHRYKYFKHVKNFGTVITAGANHGMYARFYARIFKWVYAFEPDPLNFHCLTLNCQLDNVVKINCALGETNGFCDVVRNTKFNTGTWTINDKGSTVPVLSIDSLRFPAVDFIQLDMEGYELQALKGAQETIRRCHPVVVVENGGKDKIVDFLSHMNYEFAEQSVADTIYIPR